MLLQSEQQLAPVCSMQGGPGLWGPQVHIRNKGKTVTIQACSHSFSTYLLSYSAPDAVLDAERIASNKTKIPALTAHMLRRMVQKANRRKRSDDKCYEEKYSRGQKAMTGRANLDRVRRKACLRQCLSHSSRDLNKVMRLYVHAYLYIYNSGYVCLYIKYTHTQSREHSACYGNLK